MEILGKFNGMHMESEDGELYPITQNYVSKSKLLVGDLLKLKIGEDGSFRFKQICPVLRKNIIGEVVFNGKNASVRSGNKTYKIINASVTYFKIQNGDRVTALIPKDDENCEWCAIEMSV